MGKKDRPKKNRYRAVIAIVIAGIVFLTFPRAEERNFRELLTENAELELLNAFCPVIAAAGVQARIPEVMIGCMNPKAGCAGSIYNLLQEPAFNHQVSLFKGVLEEECSQMLKDFFRSLRTRLKI